MSSSNGRSFRSLTLVKVERFLVTIPGGKTNDDVALKRKNKGREREREEKNGTGKHTVGRELIIQMAPLLSVISSVTTFYKCMFYSSFRTQLCVTRPNTCIMSAQLQPRCRNERSVTCCSFPSKFPSEIIVPPSIVTRRNEMICL